MVIFYRTDEHLNVGFRPVRPFLVKSFSLRTRARLIPACARESCLAANPSRNTDDVFIVEYGALNHTNNVTASGALKGEMNARSHSGWRGTQTIMLMAHGQPLFRLYYCG